MRTIRDALDRNLAERTLLWERIMPPLLAANGDCAEQDRVLAFYAAEHARYLELVREAMRLSAALLTALDFEFEYAQAA